MKIKIKNEQKQEEEEEVKEILKNIPPDKRFRFLTKLTQQVFESLKGDDDDTNWYIDKKIIDILSIYEKIRIKLFD